jgi:hypothetical protein
VAVRDEVDFEVGFDERENEEKDEEWKCKE